MGMFIRGLLKEGIFDAAFRLLVFLAGIGSPFLVAAVTAVVGYAQGVPVAYIIAAAAVVLAMMVTFLLRLDELISRRTVRGKLAFESVRIGKQIGADGRLCVGIVVASSASFELEFEVVKLVTSLRDKFPEKRPFKGSTKLSIPPHGRAWFWDNSIELTSNSTEVVEGLAEYDFIYGKPGALKHHLLGRKGVTVHFSEGVFTSSTWYEAV